MRKEPFNPLETTLKVVSRGGPQASDRTLQLLRQYDLVKEHKKDCEPVLVRLQEELAEDPTPEKCYAVAELAYIGGLRAKQQKKPQQAVDFFGAAVAHAYLYLFDPRFESVRNHYDPMFRQACDIYNLALESTLRIVKAQDGLVPGRSQQVRVGDRTINVNIVLRGGWRNEDVERLEFVSDYELEGLNNRHHTYGLGVPLIAVRRCNDPSDPAEKYYPRGLSFAVTAFLRVEPYTGAKHTECELELHDPLFSRITHVGPWPVPLETDLSTPLAYFLDTPETSQTAQLATLGLLNPNRVAPAAGLFMVEPYNPHKIPVLMVHGLWSSPLTWMEMFNDLRSFPEIRERYQFWFYLYPTGQPFWVSATQLRRDLQAMRETLDPGHRAPALNYMVLVGHSMGGLVSRMQTIDSQDDFWRIVSDQPFDKLEASEEDRRELANRLFFTPNPNVRRVVTIGTPHRGSEFANSYTRWIGRALIKLPSMVVSSNERMIRSNPEVFRNPELLTITTSIDSLAPDSPILPVLLESRHAPWVKYHNIVGVVPDEGLVGKIAAESDGIVGYASAHLDEALSEIVVTADHMTVHQHPRSILEVRRILHDNLRDYDWETASAAPVLTPRGPSAPTPRLLAPPGYLAPPGQADDDLAPLPPEISTWQEGTSARISDSPQK